MVKITRGLEARCLYTAPEGETINFPKAQPGMNLTYISNGQQSEGLVDKVFFDKDKKDYWQYHLHGLEKPLDEASILDYRWSDTKPDFLQNETYSFRVFPRPGIVEAQVLTQSSLAKHSDIYLIGPDLREVYYMATTTLSKLKQGQNQSPSPAKFHLRRKPRARIASA